MKTSDAGIAMVASFEGCKLTAYYDANGKVWTIGYGHTSGVKAGQRITKETAEKYLREDIAWAEQAVNAYNPKYQWNQNEFDALVSFTFNCGVGNLSKLLVNGKRSKTMIPERMKLYNKSGGVVLNGLVKRREIESELFCEPCDDSGEDDDNLCEVVKDVIRGKYGNGSARVVSLTNAGYDYLTVQTLVNQEMKRMTEK